MNPYSTQNYTAKSEARAAHNTSSRQDCLSTGGLSEAAHGATAVSKSQHSKPQNEQSETDEYHTTRKPTNLCFTVSCLPESLSEISRDFPPQQTDGADTSKMKPLPLREKLTYEKLFYKLYTPKNPKKMRGGLEQRIYGWPFNATPACNMLKRDTIRAANQGISANQRGLVQQRPQTTANQTVFSDSAKAGRGAKINTVQYIGIAADEPERIKRHTKPGVELPLVEMGWEEAYCRKWCEENDLLSPIYTTATRGGCWFCHNQGVDQLRLLRKNYPDLWALMLKWDLDSPVTFHADGHTVHDFDKRFQLEDEGILIPGDRKFRWAMLNDTEHNLTMEGW